MHLNSFMCMLDLENSSQLCWNLLIRTTPFVLYEDAEGTLQLNQPFNKPRTRPITKNVPWVSEAGEVDYGSDTTCSGQWFLHLCWGHMAALDNLTQPRILKKGALFSFSCQRGHQIHVRVTEQWILVDCIENKLD